MTTTSRLEGQTSAEAIKAPCKATSDSNLTLSGEQTINSISCVTGDRVLVKSQTNTVENGIYIVSTSGWTRANDFNGARDIVQGTRINVTSGANAGDYLVATANPITIGTTGITFTFIPVTEITELSQLDGDSDDITQGSTNLYMTVSERSKLAGISPLAEVNDDIVAGNNVTVTGGSGSDWTIDAGAGATSLDDLTDVTADGTVDGGIYGLQYDSAGGGSYDDVLLGSMAEQDSDSVTITGGSMRDILVVDDQYVFKLPTYTTTGIYADDTAARYDLIYAANPLLSWGAGLNVDVNRNAQANVKQRWFGRDGTQNIFNADASGPGFWTFNSPAEFAGGMESDSVTITGGNATLTGGTFTDAMTTDLQAATSAGLNFKTNGGATAFSFGGGGSTTLVLNGSLSFGGTTYTDATGADTKLVSGTAGTSGNLVEWNADGDAVDSGVSAGDFAQTGSANTWTAAQDFSGATINARAAAVSVSGTTKTLALTDENTFQECSNSSAQTITIPTNASVAFPTGTWITFEQHGAGAVGVEGDDGVTLNGTEAGSGGYDVENASYASDSFDVNSQDGAPRDVAFKSDGLKMYVNGAATDSVYQYSLSSAWDVSTATYDSVSFSFNSQENDPNAMFFKPDGTSFYIVGQTNDTVYQYDLSSAWDLSTATYASKSFSVNSQESTPRGLAFGDSGSKMYVVGALNNTVYEYTLSSAWDVSTASYASNSFDFSSQDGNVQGIRLNDDGSKLYAIGSDNDAVYQYSLSTNWDVSSASYDSISFSVSAQSGAPQGLTFEDSGSRMFIVDSTADDVFQYDTSSTTTNTVSISAQWGAITIRKIGTDAWIAYGSIA